jgi:hypothetical protein
MMHIFGKTEKITGAKKLLKSKNYTIIGVLGIR